MKIALIIFGIYAIASLEYVSAQQNQIQAEAPTKLSALNFGTHSTDSVYLIWMRSRNVASYIIRIYRRSDNVLYTKLPNIPNNFKNVTDLASGTRYYATVSAVYINSAGVEIDSPESNRVNFATATACNNGQIFLSCSARCIDTCDNPQPVCTRECSPGCGCPQEYPIWHEGKCIPQSQCPRTTSAGPVKPENVEVLIDGDNILLAWTPVEFAQSYTVKVRVAGTGAEVHEIETIIPIVPIPNLVYGETYEFSVRITPRTPQVTLRRQQRPPPRIVYARDITNNGFVARWVPQTRANTYTFVLYDQNQTNVLAVQEGISGTSVVVDRLAPGTTYFFAVASAAPSGKIGPFSNLRQISTTGTAVDMGNVYSSVIIYTPVHTTTTLAPTIITPRARITRCRQYYESVGNFYNEFPGVNGPEYPDCDNEGMFVTKKCTSATPPRECWCIDRVNGDKVAGSEFGIGYSNFELNCDHFGSLNVGSLEMEARNLSSTSVEVQWNQVNSVRGYVLTVDNGIQKPKTISIDGSSTTSYQIHNLRPGQNFQVGVYAVDMQGRSSPVTRLELTSSLLDEPQNVIAKKLTPTSIQLSWRYSLNADGASVKLISQDTREIMRSFKVSATSVIITDLAPARYQIEVREIRCDVICDNPQSSVLHSSEPAIVDMLLQCNMPVLDLIFAFDASPESGLELQKQIAEEITRRVPTINHSTGTRIAAVKYYQHANTVFNYASFDDTNNIIDRIRNITSSDTSSNTAYMLDFVRTRYFNPRRSEAYRQRRNSVAAIVVFSGGPARSTNALQHASSQLKSRTTVVAIGTSSAANQQVLSQLATNSDMKYAVPSPDNISSTATRITQHLCLL